MSKAQRGRHSFVNFYMDDWAGGTFRMPRLVRSVYFDVCFYNWDKAAPMPEAEVMLTFSDLGSQGDDILAALVASGKLSRDERGIWSKRAIEIAEYAIRQWSARSRGGKGRQGMTDEGEQQDSSSSAEADQEEEEQEKAPPKPKRTFNSQSVVDAWNDYAKPHGLSPIKSLTEERRKRLNARLDEHGEEVIIAAIQTIGDSPFLMGGGDRGWKIKFDDLVKPGICARLIEGAYHNQGGGRGSAWRDEQS
jgi:hypothetical protein